MTEYFKIGRFVAAHGVQGELVLQHSLGRKTSLKGLEALFIEERKDSFLPWFITSATARNEDQILIRLEGVDNREAATRLARKEVWLPETDFKRFAARTAPAGLLGYTVVQQGEVLGRVLEVIEQPHQVLCRIEIQGREALIPVNDSTLEKINHRKKELIVRLPDGLLDIYLT